MADGILTPCNVARSRHWFRQVTAPCNVALGWHAIEFANTSGHIRILQQGSISTTPPQTTSAPVSEILSKSDHPPQRKMTSCRFSRWRISTILDFMDPIMGSLKSPCTTSYRSLIDTIALNHSAKLLCFWENRVFLHFGDRQTDKHTDEQMDSSHSTDALSHHHHSSLL